MRERVTAVMVSCQQRTTARRLTIPQLKAIGITPRLFLDDCVLTKEKTELGNKWIGQKAIAWALETHPTKPVLFLEDDIDLAPDFPRALADAITTGVTTYFYINEMNPHDSKTKQRIANLYGPQLADSITARQPLPVRAVRAITYAGLYGTQAVLLPANVARLVVDQYVGEVRKAIDAAVQKCLTLEGLPVNVIVPNVVQHRHDRTAREPERFMKRSLSFHCPREELVDAGAA